MAAVLCAALCLPVSAFAEDLEAAHEAASTGKWKDAAAAFRKAFDAGKGAYADHVRYQQVHARTGAAASELVAYYDGLVKAQSGNVDVRLHRARVEPLAGRAKLLGAIAKDHAGHCGAHLELGRLALETGDANRALSALKRAASIAGGARSDVTVLLARAYAEKGKPKDGLKLLDRVVRADAGDFEAWLALARLQLETGDPAQAVKSAESALILRPRSVRTLLVHAQGAKAAGDTKTALSSAGTAERLAPQLPETSTALADYVSMDPTEANLARAAGLYRKALAVDDDFAGALQGLGWVLERQAKWEDAEKQYRALAAVKPSDPQVPNSIGWCLFKRGRVSEAQVYFRKASDLDKKFGPALANLGMTYDAQKKYSRAIKIYEKVLRLPGHKDDLRVIINCALDYESLGSYSKAVKLFERALKIKPNDAAVMTWLGDCLFFQKKWSKAEDWYEKATDADPKRFTAWRGLGYALMQRKKWAQAAGALERAMALEESDTDVPLALGDIYLNEIEDLRKALAAYQAYVDRGGDDPDIPELITDIENRLK